MTQTCRQGDEGRNWGDNFYKSRNATFAGKPPEAKERSIIQILSHGPKKEPLLVTL